MHDVLYAELLLVDVGCVTASGQAGHGGQVAAVAAHHLDDEHTTLGALKKRFGNYKEKSNSCFSTLSAFGLLED